MYKVLWFACLGKPTVPKGFGPQVILTDSGSGPKVAEDAEGLPEEIKLAFCEWNLGWKL